MLTDMSIAHFVEFAKWHGAVTRSNGCRESSRILHPPAPPSKTNWTATISSSNTSPHSPSTATSTNHLKSAADGTPGLATPSASNPVNSPPSASSGQALSPTLPLTFPLCRLTATPNPIRCSPCVMPANFPHLRLTSSHVSCIKYQANQRFLYTRPNGKLMTNKTLGSTSARLLTTLAEKNQSIFAIADAQGSSAAATTPPWTPCAVSPAPAGWCA